MENIITVEGVDYKSVREAFINHDGNAEMYAIRADAVPDEDGLVNLYVFRYVIVVDDEDYDVEWYDRIDWEDPDDVGESDYRWLVAENRIV